MCNHNNKRVVYLWEQLIELSKAQAMTGIRPQIWMSLREDVVSVEQEQDGEN